MTDFLNGYTKDFIESGNVPVEALLANSVYYPACYIDGAPVKYFNERFGQYGIQSYVYADYGITPSTLTTEQEGFRYYHIFAERELKKSDLAPRGWNPAKYMKFFSREEIERMNENFRFHDINPKNAFGRWIVYERNSDVGEERGPERFSLLYLCADGAAAYAALYLERKIAPRVLTIIHPGTGWGGNYTDFFDPNGAFMKIICSGLKRPEQVYLLNDQTVQFTNNIQAHIGV